MTAKEFLSQARYLDMRINSKAEQIESLNSLATKCTTALTGMPHNPSTSTSLMADAVSKIVDLQAEISKDMQELVKLKHKVSNLIKSVPNYEYQTLLEKRYLCFQSWEQIAVDMNFSMQHSFRIHDKALKEIELIYEDESKCDRKRVGKCDMITIEKKN